VANRRNKPAAAPEELTTAVVGETKTETAGATAAGKPAPGVRPVRPRRPSGKRER